MGSTGARWLVVPAQRRRRRGSSHREVGSVLTYAATDTTKMSFPTDFYAALDGLGWTFTTAALLGLSTFAALAHIHCRGCLCACLNLRSRAFLLAVRCVGRMVGSAAGCVRACRPYQPSPSLPPPRVRKR